MGFDFSVFCGGFYFIKSFTGFCYLFILFICL